MGTREVAQRNGKLGGRPPGSLNKLTLEKMKVKEQYQRKVMQAAERLFGSQLHLAVGQTFLYKIRKKPIMSKGKVSRYESLPPKLVTDPEEIEQFLMGHTGQTEVDKGPGATYYFLTTKEPSAAAIRDMFDRTLDKASQPHVGDPEHPIEVNVNQITFKRYGKNSKGAKSGG